MKKAIYVIFFFLILSVTLLSTESKGSLFIVSDSGFRVYLDGDLKGVTSEDIGGLWLQDLSPGILKVKMQKQGFNAILFKVNIVIDETVEKTIDTNMYKIITEKNNNPYDYLNYNGIYIATFKKKDRGFIIKFTKTEYILLAFDEEYAYYKYLDSDDAKKYQNPERKELIEEIDNWWRIASIPESEMRYATDQKKGLYYEVKKRYYKRKYSIDFDRKKIILEDGLYIDIITEDRLTSPKDALFDIPLTFGFMSDLETKKIKLGY